MRRPYQPEESSLKTQGASAGSLTPMNYQVIARKWRPQTFADVVGQQHVSRTLQNAIQSNRVAHAYIFSGVRGVGKTTTARILAKALNCEKGPAAEPCNQCDRCREISAGSSLDVLEIDAASNRGIDQIRELREMVRYAPAVGRYKVVILDEAHQLTEEASNALLKTLEEPPERVIFILATTAPESLPETIRSRAQHFHFRSLSFGEISDSLERVTKAEGLEIEPAAVAVLARAAEGSLRDALSLVEQAIAYCDRSISDREVRELLGVVSEEALDEMVDAVASSSAERALALVHQIISSGENLDSFCREAIRHVRNLLVVRIAGADSPMVAASADERPRLDRQAERFTEEDLTRFFQILLSTQTDLRRQPDPRLHLEMGLLRLVNAARLAPLEELLAELRGEIPPVRAAGPSTPTPPPAPARSGNPPAGSGHARSSSASFSAPASSTPVPSPARPVSQPERSESQASLSAAAPTPAPVAPVSSAASASPAAPNEPESAESSATAAAPVEAETEGLDAAQVQALKEAAFESQQKFLGYLLDQVSRWEVADGELRIYFPGDQASLVDMLQARERMERLRTLAAQVLGQPLRVCVKLASSWKSAANAAPSPRPSGVAAENLYARYEQNPAVRAVLERFGGRISAIKPAGES